MISLPLPSALQPALLASLCAILGASGCSSDAPVVDEKLVASLAASERGEIDRYQQRLDTTKLYRAQTKKLFERTTSEVELVENAKAAAESLHNAIEARSTHATAHVGAQVQDAAKARTVVAKNYVNLLDTALAHVKLRREYMESYDIAAEDAVALGTAELEKVKVSALAKANKIEGAKVKVSEFDVAVRAAKTKYSGHIEAAAKVRVALVKAKLTHDDKRVSACQSAQGPARWLLSCADKNGAPWAMTLPEAETLDRLQENALKGRAPEEVVDDGVNALSNDIEGERDAPATPPVTKPRGEPLTTEPPTPSVPMPSAPMPSAPPGAQ